jgi:hypothetical protein
MHVKTTGPAAIIYGSGTILTRKNKALLTLERTREPEAITSISDSLTDQITVFPKNSIA